jgi:membrane protein
LRVPGLRGLSVAEVGKRVAREVSEDDCAGQAAQLAYYFLFSLFPLLLFLVTLIGYLPVPDLFDRMMDAASRVLPPQALSLVRDTIGNITSQQRGGLLSLGAVVALWSASAGFRAIMSSLNRAYDVREGRPWWKYYGISLLATIGLSILAIAAFGLLIFGPQIGHAIASYVGLGEAFDTVWGFIRWPVALVLLTLVLAGVYYVAPDVEQDFRWLTPGSVLAVVGWVAASIGFSIYVQNFGSYDKTYGSVGAVIVLLTWLYLTGFLLLVGGETNAVVEHLAPAGKRPGAKEQADAGPGSAGPSGEAATPRGAASEWRGPGPPPAVLPPGQERRRDERRRAERRHLHVVRRPDPEAPNPPAAPEARGTIDAIREAGHETQRLVSLQARLAATELRAAARGLVRGVGVAAGGVAVACVGLLYLCAAAVVLLAGVLPLWLAALVVSAVGLVASAVAIRLGIGRVRRRARGAKAERAEGAQAEQSWP